MAAADRKHTRWKYLSAISITSGGTTIARTKDLSEKLGITPASVTEMLRTLTQNGFVEYRPYKGARLTSRGREEVRKAEERRSVLQKFFHLIGMSMEDSEHQAREMESRISDETFYGLKNLVSGMDSPMESDVGNSLQKTVREHPVIFSPY